MAVALLPRATAAPAGRTCVRGGGGCEGGPLEKQRWLGVGPGPPGRRGFGEHLALRTTQVCREGWGRGSWLTAEGPGRWMHLSESTASRAGSSHRGHRTDVTQTSRGHPCPQAPLLGVAGASGGSKPSGSLSSSAEPPPSPRFVNTVGPATSAFWMALSFPCVLGLGGGGPLKQFKLWCVAIAHMAPATSPETMVPFSIPLHPLCSQTQVPLSA